MPGKPLSITETAAFFAPGVPGEDELTIKQLWWDQVFSGDLTSRFPQLHMINWFEWRKFETEVNSDVDWSVTHDPRIAATFVAALPDSLRFAAGQQACQ
jgi:hypothetical protein